MENFIKLEQNLSGIWVELVVTKSSFDPKDGGEDLKTWISNFSKSENMVLVYEDSNGNNMAISFNGTAGPLRITYFQK